MAVTQDELFQERLDEMMVLEKKFALLPEHGKRRRLK